MELIISLSRQYCQDNNQLLLPLPYWAKFSPCRKKSFLNNFLKNIMLKKFKKKFFYPLVTLVLIGALSYAEDHEPSKKITIGVVPGAHVDVMEFVKGLAAKKGLDIKIIEFNDYVLPNAALAQGDLDLNSYQHEPFLDEQVKSRKYKITSIGKTILFPIALYSKKIQDLKELKDKAKIAIPNDPTNGARALLLLQKEGLITLKEQGTNHTLTVLDIKDNPKQLKIIEIEAPQIPRTLDDVDAAVVNTDWALSAGLNPCKDAIAIEGTDSPYANVIVSRIEDKDKKEFSEFVKIYQSPETEEFIKAKFGCAAIPAWK